MRRDSFHLPLLTSRIRHVLSNADGVTSCCGQVIELGHAYCVTERGITQYRAEFAVGGLAMPLTAAPWPAEWSTPIRAQLDPNLLSLKVMARCGELTATMAMTEHHVHGAKDSGRHDR